MILISIYLINTQNATDEYLTVLTEDLRLICDLYKDNSKLVTTPDEVEIEGANGNILIATHNHFFLEL